MPSDGEISKERNVIGIIQVRIKKGLKILKCKLLIIFTFIIITIIINLL